MHTLPPHPFSMHSYVRLSELGVLLAWRACLVRLLAVFAVRSALTLVCPLEFAPCTCLVAITSLPPPPALSHTNVSYISALSPLLLCVSLFHLFLFAVGVVLSLCPCLCLSRSLSHTHTYCGDGTAAMASNVHQ